MTAMTTQQDIDSITGSDLTDYVKVIAPLHYRDLLEWQTALYVRGIITQEEALDGRSGAETEEELLEDIATLKGRCARWMAS